MTTEQQIELLQLQLKRALEVAEHVRILGCAEWKSGRLRELPSEIRDIEKEYRRNISSKRTK